jgi:hypothetical protein
MSVLNPVFNVGDVLYGSWGYDQTNVEFFEIVKLVGKSTVEIMERGHEMLSGGGAEMSARVIPAKAYIGLAMRKRIDRNGRVKLHDFCRLAKWDGSPKYKSWYA